MPRAKPKVRKPAHRPQIPIDWNIVDKYLEAGCNGPEIASVVGCSANTIYDRCESEKGVTFSTYSALKRAKGDAIIKAKQMAFAMTGKSGNLGMLIWLGKNRLGQREDPHQDIEFNGKLSETLDILKSLKVEKETEK
jgi:hypothetical protein